MLPHEEPGNEEAWPGPDKGLSPSDASPVGLLCFLSQKIHAAFDFLVRQLMLSCSLWFPWHRFLFLQLKLNSHNDTHRLRSTSEHIWANVHACASLLLW